MTRLMSVASRKRKKTTVKRKGGGSIFECRGCAEREPSETVAIVPSSFQRELLRLTALLHCTNKIQSVSSPLPPPSLSAFLNQWLLPSPGCVAAVHSPRSLFNVDADDGRGPRGQIRLALGRR